MRWAWLSPLESVSRMSDIARPNNGRQDADETVSENPYFALASFRGVRITFLNTRSNASGLSSAPISRAALMKRFDCSGSSGGGFGLRGIGDRYVA
jgi:hypothetical protein